MNTTLTLLNMWVILKLSGYVLSIIFMISLFVISYLSQRPTYYKIELNGNTYWYRYKWIQGSNTAWLYRKRLLYGYKRISKSIILSGCVPPRQCIRSNYKDGKIEWRK